MKRLLQISLLANVALLGFAARLLLNRQEPAASDSRSAAVIPQSAEPLRKTPGPADARPFHWSQIESPDYRTYIANLRGIGCPEQTIRDLITADLANCYEGKCRQLTNAWERGDMDAAALRAKTDQLRREQLAIITALLGSPENSRSSVVGRTSGADRADHGARVGVPSNETSLSTAAPTALSETGGPETVRTSGEDSSGSNDPSTTRAADVAANSFLDERPASMPLVFANSGTVDQPGDDPQQKAVNQLKRNFVDSVGDTHDPASPDYLHRWQGAQVTADMRFRAQFGWDAFNQWGLRNQRQQLAGAQSGGQ